MNSEDKENAEAVLSYQKYVEAVSVLYARATLKATADLSNDILDILDTYRAKGGFESIAEARAYLNGFIEPKDRAVLIEAARRLPEPYRTQELTRLSSPAYNWRIKRKMAIDKAQKLAAKNLDLTVRETIGKQLDRVVKEGCKRTAYSVQKQVGLGFRFDLPPQATIDQVVRGTGVYDLVKLFDKKQMIMVREIITSGMLSGRPAKDVEAEVMRMTAHTEYESRRLVRTTAGQASADAEMLELHELQIEEYEVACVFDEKTCPICRQYDGKRYKVGQGPTPTFHPNCRCRVRQVIPEKYRRDLTKAARDSDGKTVQVPYDMTYDEWNAKYGRPSAQQAIHLQKMPKLR